jgi:hypothetical protein
VFGVEDGRYRESQDAVAQKGESLVGIESLVRPGGVPERLGTSLGGECVDQVAERLRPGAGTGSPAAEFTNPP